ncbi:MAG: hypothetical protein HYS13_13245 [Planctomycetia bacterium]|nr:hypothetical protein [Planctomycetia bacterium]
MTPSTTKILFDENIPRLLVSELARLMTFALEDERADVRHLLDFTNQQGVWDEVWIPRAAQEEWMVIAADRGKKGTKKGDKLPRLCAAYGMTLVLLSRRVHVRPRFQKLLTILSVWHELIEIGKMRGPLRFNLEPLSMAIESRGRGRLVRRDTPPSAVPSPTPPGHLF